jgi:hypothetical protein
LMLSEEAVRVFGRLYVRATGRIAQTVAEFSGEYLNQALQVAEACAMALRETRVETEGGG